MCYADLSQACYLTLRWVLKNCRHGLIIQNPIAQNLQSLRTSSMTTTSCIVVRQFSGPLSYHIRSNVQFSPTIIVLTGPWNKGCLLKHHRTPPLYSLYSSLSFVPTILPIFISLEQYPDRLPLATETRYFTPFNTEQGSNHPIHRTYRPTQFSLKGEKERVLIKWQVWPSG